jgi:hypothetical protein
LSFISVIRERTSSAPAVPQDRVKASFVARTLFLAVVLLAFVGGMLFTDSGVTVRVIAGAGGDWANLLRAMAGLKLLFACAAGAAVLCRLGAPISAMRWCGYALAAGAAFAGPGLIWGLAHIGLGALLLHGGLIASALLIWRDPAAHAMLSESVAIRARRRDQGATKRITKT